MTDAQAGTPDFSENRRDAERWVAAASTNGTFSGPAAQAIDTIIHSLERTVAELQAHCDRLTGMRFSDRMHAALVSRAESAEARALESRQILVDGMNRVIASWPCSQGTVEQIRNETLDRLDAAIGERK